MVENILKHFYNLMEYMQCGGVVMAPLIFVSVLMWIFIINRVLFFKRLYFKNMSHSVAKDFIQTGMFPDEKYKGAASVIVNEYLKRKSGVSRLDEYIIDEVILNFRGKLDSYLSIIGVFAGVAPLLGLLGTVMGMITTFDVISMFGTGNAKAMAGGISEALITTQTGLLVAIPGLYMHNFLQARSEKLKKRVDSLGLYLKRYL